MRSTALLPLAFAALAASTAAQAQSSGWQWLPGLTDPNFKAEASLAVTGNRVIPDEGRSSNAWGLDFNMNCGLLQSPDKRIRTHVNFSRSNKDGVQGTNWELSPRYTMPVREAPGLSLGIGPSLGLFSVKSAASDHSYTGLGLATGLNYRAGPLYTGLDVRYHRTTSHNGVSLDPVTWGAKIGLNF